MSDIKNISSLLISWTAIPDEHVMGILLGYHVTYKAIKRADQYVKDTEPVALTVAASGRHELILESLSQFTQYRITVAGYTAAGLGKASKVLGGKKNILNLITFFTFLIAPQKVENMTRSGVFFMKLRCLETLSRYAFINRN